MPAMLALITRAVASIAGPPAAARASSGVKLLWGSTIVTESRTTRVGVPSLKGQKIWDVVHSDHRLSFANNRAAC